MALRTAALTSSDFDEIGQTVDVSNGIVPFPVLPQRVHVDVSAHVSDERAVEPVRRENDCNGRRCVSVASRAAHYRSGAMFSPDLCSLDCKCIGAVERRRWRRLCCRREGKN